MVVKICHRKQNNGLEKVTTCQQLNLKEESDACDFLKSF